MNIRVTNILASSQWMDLTPGDLHDVAYGLFEKAGSSPAAIKRIQNVILMDAAMMDCDEMLTVRIVDEIPPDGDDNAE